MLQLKNISKKYTIGEFTQTALDDVSLNFRENEFVAILGPSGSGKTTLLNIIGGLDRYDQGDIIINDVSTKKYKDRDWDSYRNNSVGFVFQSYNLIPHQSVLSNVELALTISGVSRKERKERAKKALKDVGLEDHMSKRPNQLSGGQMQRVAIARALINNPAILLADEPTGALDTETSLQIMALLEEVAKDRLVVMVTHNPELAEKYATRTIRLRDGEVVDDSHPFLSEDESGENTEKKTAKTSMSFLTSLALSFNNLMTKKGRTILTALAGSIGIIGIALILALSNGVNNYIEDIQRDTMTSYPIKIDEQTIDFSSLMGNAPMNADREVDHAMDAIYSDGRGLEFTSQLTTSLEENNLSEFKNYLDKEDSPIHDHIRENGIIYSYDVKFDVYSFNDEDVLVDANKNAFVDYPNQDEDSLEGEYEQRMMSGMPQGNSDLFDELLPGGQGNLVSQVTKDSYELLTGRWPESFDELVLVLDEHNEISTTALYSLGLLPEATYQEIKKDLDKDETYTAESYSFDYKKALDQSYYLLSASDYYIKNKSLYDYVKNDDQALLDLIDEAQELKIIGVIKPIPDATNANLRGALAYTHDLTNYLIDYANESQVVKEQLDNPQLNILNGFQFEPDNDQEKIEDVKSYFNSLGISEKAKAMRRLTLVSEDEEAIGQMQMLDELQLSEQMDGFILTAEDEDLIDLYDLYLDVGNYEDNLKDFGYVSLDAPSQISLYAETFEGKDAIAQAIDDYNKQATDDNKITYTDLVAIMTQSITSIINVISYVLIAFVAVSLVVSSIMIGIITYISVVERTKEIGILRALGASKRNIAQVFNAETFIIGLFAGILGIAITILLTYPINNIIDNLVGPQTVKAILPYQSAVILIILSVILTLIGGLIPSRKAANKDPVEALRTE